MNTRTKYLLWKCHTCLTLHEMLKNEIVCEVLLFPFKKSRLYFCRIIIHFCRSLFAHAPTNDFKERKIKRHLVKKYLMKFENYWIDQNQVNQDCKKRSQNFPLRAFLMWLCFMQSNEKKIFRIKTILKLSLIR